MSIRNTGRAKKTSTDLVLTRILPEPGLIQTRATAFLRLTVAYARPCASTFFSYFGASGAAGLRVASPSRDCTVSATIRHSSRSCDSSRRHRAFLASAPHADARDLGRRAGFQVGRDQAVRAATYVLQPSRGSVPGSVLPGSPWRSALSHHPRIPRCVHERFCLC